MSGETSAKSLPPIYGRAKKAEGRAALVPAYAKERRGHECAPLPRVGTAVQNWATVAAG